MWPFTSMKELERREQDATIQLSIIQSQRLLLSHIDTVSAELTRRVIAMEASMEKAAASTPAPATYELMLAAAVEVVAAYAPKEELQRLLDIHSRLRAPKHNTKAPSPLTDAELKALLDSFEPIPSTEEVPQDAPVQANP